MGNVLSSVLQELAANQQPSLLKHPFNNEVVFSFKEYRNLVSSLRNYKAPGPHNVANIVLLGPVGAGKSSFVCSVAGHLRGRISRRALAGSASDSLTSRLHKFTLQGEGPDSVRFRLWDTAGWTPAKSEACLAACAALLDGRLAHGADMAQPPADEGWEAVGKPALVDKPHCVCLCIPCRSASDCATMDAMRDLLALARDRGIPTLVLLTKIDEYDPAVIVTDIKRTFHSIRLRNLITGVADDMGVPPNCVVPLLSPVRATLPDSDSGALLLHALRHALLAATDCLLNQNDA